MMKKNNSMIENKLKGFIERLRPNFLCKEIEKLIFPQCQTLLDVGCGENSVVKFLNKKLKTIGVDLFKKALSRSMQQKIHNGYKRIDVLDIDKYFKKKSFDCVLAIDVVEHLKKNRALLLIKKMEKLAKKIVIIRTTNGFVKQEAVDRNPFQLHLSGFKTKDLEKMDYKLLGMDGPKFLRVNEKGVYLRKNFITSVLANLLDPLIRSFPQMSFNILAYKILDE